MPGHVASTSAAADLVAATGAGAPWTTTSRAIWPTVQSRRSAELRTAQAQHVELARRVFVDGSAEHGARSAAELGHPALAMTEHAVLSGVVHHIDACREVGITPIVGVEAYYRERRQPFDKETNWEYFHMLLLAKNIRGWRSLKLLTSASLPLRLLPQALHRRRAAGQVERGDVHLDVVRVGLHPARDHARRRRRRQSPLREADALGRRRLVLRAPAPRLRRPADRQPRHPRPRRSTAARSSPRATRTRRISPGSRPSTSR
jgi:hypothetical protein